MTPSYRMRMRMRMASDHFFFDLALGFGFAVFAAFLKSCADGASLLLGFLGFFPAARRLRMFSYKPGLAMSVLAVIPHSDEATHNKTPEQVPGL